MLRPALLSISTAKSLSFDKRPFILSCKDNSRPLLIMLAIYDNWQLTAILEMLEILFFVIFLLLEFAVTTLGNVFSLKMLHH